ncbi:MAG: iron-containing alcohol dehydrogenase family protein [Candidatus Njordarchaeia archaeon]
MYRSINIPLEIDLVHNEEIKDTLKDLDRYVSPIHKILLITTEHLYDLYLNGELKNNIDVAYIEDAYDETVTEIYQKHLKDSEKYGLIVGFGGGKVVDVSKYVAYMRLLPVIVIPTTLSNDGIASPISVLKERTGRRRLSLRSQMPTKVILDLNIIKKSPRENIIAGMGDLLSNISALKDWKLANLEKGEPIDYPAYMLSHNASTNFYRKIVCEPAEKFKKFTTDILEELAYGLILSGISMAIVGSSRPASGAEHLISHAIDHLYPEKASLHGYQVAYGMLIAELLRNENVDELIEIYKKVGLPTSYKELGLTKDEVIESILFAPKIRERYTILNKVNLDRENLYSLVI